MHVNSTGTMPAGMKTGLSGFRPLLTTEKKKKRMQHPRNGASLNALLWQIQNHFLQKNQEMNGADLFAWQRNNAETDRQRLTIGPGGPLGPDAPSFPGGPCVETTYDHTWLTTHWGPWSAQCISVVALYCIQPSACHLKNLHSGDGAVPFQGMF